MILVALFFITGIFTGSFFSFPRDIPITAVILALTICVIFRSLTFACIVALVLGLWRIQLADQPAILIEAEQQTFKAKVVFQDMTLNSLQLSAEIIDGPYQNKKVMLTTNRYPLYHYGDILDVSCRLQSPEPFEDFAYDKYLALSNIRLVCFRPQLAVIKSDSGIWSQAFTIKEFFSASLRRALPEPESAIVRGILLSERKEVPASLSQKFSRTGLSHIMAISGLNIAILVYLVREVLLFFNFSQRRIFFTVFQLLLFYMVMIGWPASAVRSSLMGIIMLGGLLISRPYDMVYILIIVAAVLAALNPLAVRYDIGWQLSFLAVLGLAWWSKRFSRWLKFIPVKFGLREVMAVTLSAQFFTWPLIVYYFKILSLSAPLSNFLILPTATLIMIVGSVMPLVTYIPGLNLAWSWLLFFLTRGMLQMVSWVAKIPHGYLMIENYNETALIVSFLLIAVITYVVKKYEKNS